MVRRVYLFLARGFLIALLSTFIPVMECLAAHIPQVSDFQQPINGTLGNPTTNACAPVSVVNVTEYWDNVANDPGAQMVNAGLVPNTAADYISYFVDHGNWGSPVRANGMIYPASAGTYAVDIQPGFTEFVRWDAAHPFTTPPPALPVGKLGYDWNNSSDFAVGFFRHVAVIDSGHPDVLCFRYWNPINSGTSILDPSGERIYFYTWGPLTGGSGPPNPYETWNLNYGQECIGHAVTGVGYFINFDPDGPGALPLTNWFICHDNWPTTQVNVALPWANWAATVVGYPSPVEPPEITYWKPDTTYAFTGMPDFPSQYPCHSGATAVTNCLWWYGAMDYYPFVNSRQLKDELLIYFAADTVFDPWGGTDVHIMEAGLDAFFNDVDPPWPFYETTYQMPDFRVMAESLMKCQDVILLIGNWWQDGSGLWWRDGGRYVTMAGVDTASLSIALSDPETDNAEAGGYGRIRPPHAIHSPTDNTHWLPFTAGSFDYPVSHDVYNVMLNSPSPGGTWWIPGFPRGFSPSYANCPGEFMPMTQANPDPAAYPYHPEVEYAVMICPRTIEEPIDTCNYYKAPYPDYAQNGMPDIDQKQGNWWNQQTGNFSWCGPVALANCIWWFDSKFEPFPMDPRPFQPDPTSPPPNDHYPLLGPLGPWDDHDMNNVIPFVNTLGPMCGVDGPSPGTPLPQLQAGFNSWLASVGLQGQYTTHIVMGPGYPEIRDSILSSQDVILLLGFYEVLPTQDCQRLGGHYVTCAGVCTQELGICISDPFFDSNEGEPPPGVAHGSAVHNDAFFVSGPHGSIDHDRYNFNPILQPCPSSPATMSLVDYPNRWTQDGIFTFADENPLMPGLPPVQYQGGPIMVLVDAALIICPAPPAIPDINVRPESLYYQQQSYTIMAYPNQIFICNTGTGPLSINSITSDHSWISAGPFISPLAVGQCDSVDVIINTTGITPGFYSGWFHVNSNDPDEATVNKPWYIVRVIEPDIQVTPDSIFHSQLTNTLNTYGTDFQVYNLGSAVLTYSVTNTIAWITLGGMTGAIFPGGNDNIDVTVNTNGVPPGIYVDSVTITSNDPDKPVLNKPEIVIEVLPPEIDICDYYKLPYPDYAPNGVPDFDQKQGNWWNQQTGNFSWCGPVALANCIWWFDSKFEPAPVDPRPFFPSGPPSNDHYPLLGSIGGPWDDHDINNVIPFVNALGPMCGVDGPSPGTPLPQLQAGFHNWLISVGMPGQYTTHIVMGPGYPEIRDSILSSQDVILLLGFYEVLPTQDCQRLGGHYVTCAGACNQEPSVCISDPFFDTNEGEPPPGTAHGSAIHNDAFYVSGPHGTIHHDRYNMMPVQAPCPISPATWMMMDYPNRWTQDGIFTFANENPVMPGMPSVEYQGGPIMVLIDAALIICPAPAQQIPDINVVPDSIFHSLVTNTTGNYNDDFGIFNLGTGLLNWSATNSLSWLVLGTNSGSIAPGDDIAVSITVNATSIPVGTYLDTVRISSDDPDEPLVLAPQYVIEVTSGEVGCDYVPGDINGSGSANGIDVTYGVSFLKNGSAPKDSCDCPPITYPFYAAMDVNGSCSANGIDITFFVSYLKNIQPALLYCEDCPPVSDILPVRLPESDIEKIGTRGGGN